MITHCGNSVGWVIDPIHLAHGWDSDSSTNYIVISIKRRQEEELKIAETKLALKTTVHSTQAWFDSGSPISVFTIGELKRTLGKQNMQLQPKDPKGNPFRD